MANSEPKWPRSGAVTFEAAVELCREAFLDWQRRENDDPASDPIGTVRKDPETGLAVYLFTTRSMQCWRSTWEHDLRAYYPHEDVKGWPIIGAVPFTPAAEAKP